MKKKIKIVTVYKKNNNAVKARFKYGKEQGLIIKTPNGHKALLLSTNAFNNNVLQAYVEKLGGLV